MSRSGPPRLADSPCVQWCQRCRAHALGLGPGPYTSGQLQQLVVEPPPRRPDPDVAAAEAARDAARAVFDEVDQVWQRAAAARAAVDVHGEVAADTRRRLDDDQTRARQARDRAWAGVVAANDQLHLVSTAAQRRRRDDDAAVSPA